MSESRAADRIPMDMEIQEHAHLLQIQQLCESGGHAFVRVSPEQAKAFAFSGEVNSIRELNAALQEAWDAGVLAWWFARNGDAISAELETPEARDMGRMPAQDQADDQARGIWQRIMGKGRQRVR